MKPKNSPHRETVFPSPFVAPVSDIIIKMPIIVGNIPSFSKVWRSWQVSRRKVINKIPEIVERTWVCDRTVSVDDITKHVEEVQKSNPIASIINIVYLSKIAFKDRVFVSCCKRYTMIGMETTKLAWALHQFIKMALLLWYRLVNAPTEPPPNTTPNNQNREANVIRFFLVSSW